MIGDSDQVIGGEVKLVHTFEIVGGKPFRIDFPANPPLEHDGKRTVWKFVGTEKEAQVMELTLGLLANFTRYCESQTPELKKGRGLAF